MAAFPVNDATEFTTTLYDEDLSNCTPGPRDDEKSVITRGLGHYIEVRAKTIECGPWVDSRFPTKLQNYRFRAVVTPVSFDNTGPRGGFCGIIARYRDDENYIALVIDRTFHVKLLRCEGGQYQLLAVAPLEFCLGQSLTLTLTVNGNKAIGTAGPYAGATTIEATVPEIPNILDRCNHAGFVCAGHARFGPHTLECTAEDAAQEKERQAAWRLTLSTPGFPTMKIERTIPLKGLVTGRNIQFADINGDGKLEIIAAQSSKRIATSLSMTRLTCLTAFDLAGNILWQAGVPDPESSAEEEVEPVFDGSLPFRIHDLFGDGHPVVVCVFGYDLQIRDAKSGKTILSGETPGTLPVSDEFKAVTSSFGAPWGDETLNMNVASIHFCDTQGTGAKKEILIKDDFHNLAVLDTLSEPMLHPILRHRGNLGGVPCIGDIDGDGKDEIFCGYSLLDDDGTTLATLALGGYARSAHVHNLNSSDGAPARVLICAGDEGLIALDLQALLAGKYASGIPRAARFRIGADALHVGKFRANLLRDEIVVSQLAISHSGRDGRVSLFTWELEQICSDYLDADNGPGVPVRWTSENRSYLFFGGCGCGLFDGISKHLDMSPHLYRNYGVVSGYCRDGRDALYALYEGNLEICVPSDALTPLKS